jgi:hypothetical protein
MFGCSSRRSDAPPPAEEVPQWLFSSEPLADAELAQVAREIDGALWHDFVQEVPLDLVVRTPHGHQRLMHSVVLGLHGWSGARAVGPKLGCATRCVHTVCRCLLMMLWHLCTGGGQQQAQAVELIAVLETSVPTAQLLCTEPTEAVAEALGCTAEDAAAPMALASHSPANAEPPAERKAAAAAPASQTPQQPRITVDVAGAVQAAPEAAEKLAPATAPAAAEAAPAAAQHKEDDTCVVCSKDAGKKVLPERLHMVAAPGI